MTYAYDDYVQMPTKDLYDTAVMKMAIEAAKDMYDKGEAQMENFYKTYGDFMSPFAKDMEWYGEQMNNVRTVVNDAYARGIDLFKSPEGRAIVAQLSHSIDPGRYNAAKANAKLGYAYLGAIQEAAAKGQYSQEMQDWYLNKIGLGRFEDFSSSSGKTWNAAPIQYKSMEDLISPLVDKLDPSFDAEMTARLNDGFDYNTISRDRIMQTINDNLNDLILADPAGGFYYDQALQQSGGDRDAAMSLLKDWYANRASKFAKVTREQNPYRMYDYKMQKDLEEYKRKSAIDRVDNLLEKYDFDLNGQLDPEEIEIAKRYLTRSIKEQDTTNTPNVFREAEDYADAQYNAIYNDKDQQSEYTTKDAKGKPITVVKHNSLGVGMHVGNVGENTFDNNIDFMVPATKIELTDPNDKTNKTYAFKMKRADANDHMYAFDERTGKMTKIKLSGDSEDITFRPGMNMRAVRYHDRYEYFVNGTVNGKSVWIRVKERAFNYDKEKK